MEIPSKIGEMSCEGGLRPLLLWLKGGKGHSQFGQRLDKMNAQPYGHNQDNANVTWAKDWKVWPVYVVSLLGLRYLLDILSLSSMPLGLGWTMIHLLHAIVRLSSRITWNLLHLYLIHINLHI